MISAADIVGHPAGTAAGIRAVRESGLAVTGLEALRDFEGLDGQLHAYKLDVAKSMLEICGAIGVAPAARRGVDVGARRCRAPTRSFATCSKLAVLACRSASGSRSRALSWSRTVADFAAAGDLVFRANCPNLGLAIDAFDVIAAGVPLDDARRRRSGADLPGPAVRLHVAGDPLRRGAGRDGDATSASFPAKARTAKRSPASSRSSTRSATTATTASTSTTTTTCRCHPRPSPTARGARPTGSARPCCAARCPVPNMERLRAPLAGLTRAAPPRAAAHTTQGSIDEDGIPAAGRQRPRGFGRSASGTMMFGDRTDAAEAQRIVDAAFDAGRQFHRHRRRLRQGRLRADRRRRDQANRRRWILATKVGNPMTGRPHDGGLSRRWILQACDDSLERLATDCIDIYYLHRDDPDTPIAETVGAIGDLIRSGKIRYFGVSNYRGWRIAEVVSECEAQGVPLSGRLPALLQPAQPDARGRDPARVRLLRHRRRAVLADRARRADRQVPRRRRAGGFACRRARTRG